MPDENFKELFNHFMRHIDNRLDQIVAALSIVTNENKTLTQLVAKHDVLIEQNRKDIDSISEKFRKDLEEISKTIAEREAAYSLHNTNQHKTLFDKIDDNNTNDKKLQNEMSEIRGALKFIQIAIWPILLAVIVSLIKGFM